MPVMELLSAVFSIIVIDLVLSGDNALVIGMAAHRLPPRQRRIAIVGGAGTAIVLRVALTAVATLLLLLPYLRLIGGLLLLGIAFKLLKEEEEAEEGAGSPLAFHEAIMTIVIADFVMSMDNILAVAAAAHGNVALLIFGLVLSMAIMMTAGSVVASLLNRFGWLAYLGAAVIAWTGAEMVVDDPKVHDLLPLPLWAAIAVQLLVTAATVAAAHWFHRGRLASASAASAVPVSRPGELARIEQKAAESER